ncbi:MAG: hypothetical protein AAB706_03680 [Patescibacteria group bacterium]
MRNPKNELIPAWYELSRNKKSSFIVKVHREAFAHINTLKMDQSPIVQDYLKRFKFLKFVSPNEGTWGFNEVIQTIPSKFPEWISWECSLPVLKSGEVVSISDGKFALSTTLSVLFTALWLFEGNTKWGKPQLMVVEHVSVEKDLWGGSLSVTLTPAMCSWLSKQPHNSEITVVVETMKAADKYMWPQKASLCFMLDFRAWYREPKWINLSVPGNACGLDPDDYYDKSPRGYTLVPHNTDTILQQLTFFAGLARLHDLARQQKSP